MCSSRAGRGAADVTPAGVAELWQWPRMKTGFTLRCGNGPSGGMFLQEWRLFQVWAMSCMKVIVSLERAVETANLAISKKKKDTFVIGDRTPGQKYI